MGKQRLQAGIDRRQKLICEFEKIKKNHKLALQKRASRIVMGASVMRVFEKNTKDDLRKVLENINMMTLLSIKSHHAFQDWFKRELKKIKRAVDMKNKKNSRIGSGHKWGHCTKVLALFIREIVLNSRYFTDSQVNRIQIFLYLPIDGIIIARLKKIDCPPCYINIKKIDSAKKFFETQDELLEAATKTRVPRVWFDDNWVNRD